MKQTNETNTKKPFLKSSKWEGRGERGGEKDRGSDGERERQTDRQKHRQTVSKCTMRVGSPVDTGHLLRTDHCSKCYHNKPLATVAQHAYKDTILLLRSSSAFKCWCGHVTFGGGCSCWTRAVVRSSSLDPNSLSRKLFRSISKSKTAKTHCAPSSSKSLLLLLLLLLLYNAEKFQFVLSY